MRVEVPFKIIMFAVIIMQQSERKYDYKLIQLYRATCVSSLSSLSLFIVIIMYLIISVMVLSRMFCDC